MPVTCGSIGDIITLATLVKDVVQALDRSTGSSSAYKALIRDLTLLADVLHKVHEVAQTSTPSLELAALQSTGQHIVDSCAQSVQDLQLRLSRYGPTLGKADGNKLKAAFHKLRWLGEAEEIAKVRTEIAGHLASLNLLLSTLMWSANMREKEAVVTFTRDATARLTAQDQALVNITTDLHQHHVKLDEHRSVLLRLADGMDWLKQMGAQLKSIMTRTMLTNIATYKAVVRLQESLPNSMERLLLGEAFMFEDAMGRTAPIHFRWISSWEAFEAVLETRFRGMHSHGLVLKGQYLLQDEATGVFIDRRRMWDGAITSGHKINMIPIIEQDSVPISDTQPITTCPGCGASCSDSTEKAVRCCHCGLEFQRVVEVRDDEPAPVENTPKPTVSRPVFGVVSNIRIYGPAPAPQKRKLGDPLDTEMRSFKRLRMVSVESRRHRRQANAFKHGPGSSSRTFGGLHLSTPGGYVRSTPDGAIIAQSTVWTTADLSFVPRLHQAEDSDDEREDDTDVQEEDRTEDVRNGPPNSGSDIDSWASREYGPIRTTLLSQEARDLDTDNDPKVLEDFWSSNTETVGSAWKLWCQKWRDQDTVPGLRLLQFFNAVGRSH